MRAQTYRGTDEHSRRHAKGREHSGNSSLTHSLADLVRKRKVYLPGGTEPLTSLSLDADRGKFIFALNREGVVRVGEDGIRGQASAVKHESLFSGDDVEVAGEIQFGRGVVSDVNDKSGTYQTAGVCLTQKKMVEQLLAALDRIQVQVRPGLRDRLLKEAIAP